MAHLRGAVDNGIGDFPITFDEFNKLYFSVRPVVVECPLRVLGPGLRLMAFHSALKQIYCDHRSGFYFPGAEPLSSNLESKQREYFSILAGKKSKKVNAPVKVVTGGVRDMSVPMSADVWTLLGIGDRGAAGILDLAIMTDGFKAWDDKVYRVDRVSGKCKPRKKVVILAPGPFGYDSLKRTFPEKFAFIDYTPEKALVDNWFLENSSILDPCFHMEIANPEIDAGKVFKYIAMNRPHLLSKYNEVFPEDIEKWFTKEERWELNLL